jgi:N-acetylglucosaminyl-diphospho-decaprenol L-rhamnosyltransferase
MSTPALDVAISIPSTNNRELLERCLRALPAACDGLSWNATVVDNASTDGTAELLATQFPSVQVVRHEQRHGVADNHNAVIGPAVRDSAARYVLLIHEDIEPEPGSIRELVAFCDADPECGAAGPVIVDAAGRRLASFEAFPTPAREVWRALLPRIGPRAVQAAGWLDGPCMLLRVEALRGIGVLDDRYFVHYEDVDISYRLAKAGWKVSVCEDARIVHRPHSTIGRGDVSTAMELQMLRSRYLYFSKHYGAATGLLTAFLIRGAMGLRSGKALAGGSLARNRDERALASLLWRLARYDPRTPLPHELSTSLEG